MASPDSEDYEFASDDNSSSNGINNPVSEPVNSTETTETVPTDEQITSNGPESDPQDYEFGSDDNSSSTGDSNLVSEPSTEGIQTQEENMSNGQESSVNEFYNFDSEPESKYILKSNNQSHWI